MDKSLEHAIEADGQQPRIRAEDGEINVYGSNDKYSSDDIYKLLLGTPGNESFNKLLSQALESFRAECPNESMNILLQFLQSISPNDALEGMLAVQMITAHNMSLEMASRTMHPENTHEVISENIKRAEKLMKTFSTQMETLQKYRKKGQQTIQVQHVNVENGGQAIVGNVGDKG